MADQGQRDLQAEQGHAEFTGWFAAQGYPSPEDRYDGEEMAEAFKAGMQAERDLRAAAETGPQPAQTAMRLSVGEDWTVRPNLRPACDDEPDLKFYTKFEQDAHTGQQVPVATLRRVGWLDQKGRVWTEIPPQAGFDGGSLTPLLTDARD